MTAMQLPRGPFEEPRRVKLTVKDFLLLAEAGAFDSLPRKVELLEGVITVVSPQSTKHAGVTSDLVILLELRLREIGSPMRALTAATTTSDPSDAPEPDISVLPREGMSKYAQLAEAALVVEVSATTLRPDLGRKKRIYAKAGTPEYWVVDVRGSQVHQFWSPQGRDYAESRIVPIPGPLASVTMPDLAIDTAGLL